MRQVWEFTWLEYFYRSQCCMQTSNHTCCVDGKFRSMKLSRNTNCTQKANVHFQILELCICDIVLERRNIEGEAKGYNCSTHTLHGPLLRKTAGSPVVLSSSLPSPLSLLFVSSFSSYTRFSAFHFPFFLTLFPCPALFFYSFPSRSHFFSLSFSPILPFLSFRFPFLFYHASTNFQLFLHCTLTHTDPPFSISYLHFSISAFSSCVSTSAQCLI